VCRFEELAVGAVAIAFQVAGQDEAEGGGVDAVVMADRVEFVRLLLDADPGTRTDGTTPLEKAIGANDHLSGLRPLLPIYQARSKSDSR
jgi:hypothetical protein